MVDHIIYKLLEEKKTLKDKSNYEVTRDLMQERFLTYSQEKMIEKFHLPHDAAYLYLRFVGRQYRINRASGKVEWSEDGFVTCTMGDFHEAMSIYDVLCESKEHCHLSRKFTRINNLKGTVYSAGLGDNLNQKTTEILDANIAGFRRACEALGGKAMEIGDASYIIPTFDFLPIVLQLWQSDEEFPASLQVLWDENILSYLHYETTYYVLNHVLNRIVEMLNINPSKVQSLY